MMYEYNLTVGLFDKDTCIQEVTTESAKAVIENALLNKFDIFAFTMIECAGCYKMNDGRIVREPSIRIEIASDDCITDTIKAICETLKIELNQESIMCKVQKSEITFE